MFTVLCFPFCIPSSLAHHQSIFHQGFPIEADGISHFLSPGRRRPSDSVGRGRISGALEPLLPIRTGQQGGNTAQKYERRQSDTATRRPSLSLPQPRRKTLSRPSRDTVLRPNPRRKTEHQRTGHCSPVPPFHSFRPDWSTPQSNTGDRQTSAVRHSNPSVVSPHNGASTRLSSHHLLSPMTD